MYPTLGASSDGGPRSPPAGVTHTSVGISLCVAPGSPPRATLVPGARKAQASRNEGTTESLSRKGIAKTPPAGTPSQKHSRRWRPLTEPHRQPHARQAVTGLSSTTVHDSLMRRPHSLPIQPTGERWPG